MGFRLLFAIGMCLFISGSAMGQTKYIQTPSGVILDMPAYEKNKAEKIQSLSSSFQGTSVSLEDELILLRETADSIIYTYRRKMKVTNIDAPAVPEHFGLHGKELVGSAFPWTDLVAIDKRRLSPESLKGKPVLINFWFTTCMPCIEEMPALNQIRERLKDKVHFVSITFDSRKKVLNFLKKHDFSFTHIADAGMLIDSLQIKAFPMNVFVDKDGIVRKVANGIPYTSGNDGNFIPGDGKEFESFLRSLL